MLQCSLTIFKTWHFVAADLPFASIPLNLALPFLSDSTDDDTDVKRIGDGADNDDVEEDIEFLFLLGELNVLVCKM